MKQVLRDQNNYILRFDKDEDVLLGLKEFCSQSGITAGWFSGIGAANRVQLLYYSNEQKDYQRPGVELHNVEIVSLSGNIAVINNEVMLHCHGVFSDDHMTPSAGHVSTLVVSVTCEVVLQAVTGVINRQLDKNFNLKLMK